MVRAMEDRRGNYLAFFPSFAFRDQVAVALPDALASGSLRLIHQTPAMPAEMVLRMLRRAASGTTLLLAVHGGVFAEGVDFPDDMAIGAFVVGPGLPQLSIERQLIREYYDNRELDGFDFAFVHPGINRSVQAGGRVIRTETDRGFVLLLDARFAQERYFQKLPATWREEILWADDGDAVLRLVREFWQAQEY
jgi:DNA excision repair protein ERCC-2